MGYANAGLAMGNGGQQFVGAVEQIVAAIDAHCGIGGD
jgi:hypothetical protein